MKNSQDRNKNIIIIKFMAISVVIIAFTFFYLFYGITFIESSQSIVENYYLMGRRPALVRNLKMFMTQYVSDPTWAPSGLKSITVLNRNIID